ncbi:FAD-binding oxidoreductase [Cryptosporangium aurantiacum]|uniref:FAD binding domain-containing protein n=1 Tax=Cryptosporangium aurantiacum TaxID=134849 RepID=A0A1M7QME6_9ACTN|nr:FAD-binding oxidoreductase [Cryptosporangium aurantiacum]SHN32244.1 FAD binding domain-containing protein [Cryptosporangium aurantiacum]
MTDLTVAAPLSELTVAGRVLLPGEPGYTELAMPWNVAVPSAPIAVVEAASADDVVAAVRFAGRHGIEVSVQATGHGAPAGPQRPSLLVHTGRLDELVIDPAGSARVGAGVRWAQVLEAAAPHGLAGLAGSAPNVGVVGYLTGGGIGPVVRTFGVASDLVTAFDVVTGDGELRRVTATENPALFWGLRGGKGALGIVTAVEFELVQVAEIFGGCVYFDAADASAIAHSWAMWTEELPEEATSSLAVMRMPPMPGVPEPLAGKVTVALRFAWVGDPEQGERVVAPMLKLGTIVLGGMGVLPYAALGSIHADPVDPMPVHEASGLLSGLPSAAVDQLIALAGPDAECPQVIVELRHLGGAFARPSAHPSAFNHRHAAYTVQTIGIGAPPVVEAVTAHGDALLSALGPWSVEGCLPNFVASHDPAEVARKYDAETLTRLATLAATYDARGVIAAAQPIHAACLLSK